MRPSVARALARQSLAFLFVLSSGADFQISADCTVEGNKQTAAFILTISGDTLTFTDDGVARDFLRCKRTRRIGAPS